MELVTSQMTAASQYMAAVRDVLDVIAAQEAAQVQAAAAAVVLALQADRMIYIFGTGHSHMLAEEGHYRAGGLAPVCPVLFSALMLHEGAVASTQLERTSGLAPALLLRYNVQPGDVIFIFSNSGANSVPVEMAIAAKERRMVVIAIVALDYAATIKAGPTGRKLADVADIVIDNHGVPGDALVDVGSGLRTGPASTVSGAFILNAALTEAAARLSQLGIETPVYISGNLPDAVAHNEALIEKYRSRNPHL